MLSFFVMCRMHELRSPYCPLYMLTHVFSVHTVLMVLSQQALCWCCASAAHAQAFMCLVKIGYLLLV